MALEDGDKDREYLDWLEGELEIDLSPERLEEILSASPEDESHHDTDAPDIRQLPLWKRGGIRVIGGVALVAEMYTAKKIAIPLATVGYLSAFYDFTQVEPDQFPWLDAGSAVAMSTYLMGSAVDRQVTGWTANGVSERLVRKALTSSSSSVEYTAEDE